VQTDRRVAVVLHFAGTPTGEGDAGVVSRTCRMKTGADRYIPNGLDPRNGHSTRRRDDLS
jgi:hypothetical protein